VEAKKEREKERCPESKYPHSLAWTSFLFSFSHFICTSSEERQKFTTEVFSKGQPSDWPGVF
jgi:methionyl-tRNA synthetase